MMIFSGEYCKNKSKQDSDYDIIGSMVKKTGDCVGAYIRQWIGGKNIPMHQLYGLESGYTYFQLADLYIVENI